MMAMKFNVVGGAVLSGGQLVPYAADKGDPGPASNIPGPQGWSPVFAGELDGVRTLFKVVDWTGGAGSKPDVGPAGYVTTKAAAFNFNIGKRVMVLQAQTNAQGVATFDFTGLSFANAPSVIALPATTAVLSGPTRSTVSGVTKTGAIVTVQQQALLTAVFSVLAGATANIFVVEQ